MSFPGDQTNSSNDTGTTAIDFFVGGSSSNGDSLTYSESGLPGYLSLNASTGEISGNIPVNAGNTAFNVTATGTDADSGDAASVTFPWTINPPSAYMAFPGNSLNHNGDSATAYATGFASDSDALTYSATGLPSYLSVDSTTGEISGTVPLDAAKAVYTVTVTGTDDPSGVAASTTFYWAIDPPSVYMGFPGDQINHPGDTADLYVTGTASNGHSLT